MIIVKICFVSRTNITIAIIIAVIIAVIIAIVIAVRIVDIVQVGV